MNLIPQPDSAGLVERPSIPPGEETVYVRPCWGGGWNVHLDEDLLLFTGEEAQAFQRACEAAVIDGLPSRRMLLLSGPGATMHAGVPDPQRVRGAAE